MEEIKILLRLELPEVRSRQIKHRYTEQVLGSKSILPSGVSATYAPKSNLVGFTSERLLHLLNYVPATWKEDALVLLGFTWK